MKDTIYRQAAIDAAEKESQADGAYGYMDTKSIVDLLNNLPSAQPETYKEKLKEIADKLSEKFAYLNTCPNERDIILGYLGVERPRGMHCDTDCIITKCECNHHYTKLPSAQPEIIRCKDCKYCEHWYADKGRCFLWHEDGIGVFEDGFCNYAERRADE